MPEEPKYLGNREPFDGLDTFASPGASSVQFTGRELTCSCPVTGQPDFYNVIINYRPKEKCVESKSLKLYLMTFRDTSMYAEALSVKIAQDIHEAVAPVSLTVTLTQQVRGGLTLTTQTVL